MKKRYHSIRMMPKRLSSFQPFKWVESIKKTTVEKSDSVE